MNTGADFQDPDPISGPKADDRKGDPEELRRLNEELEKKAARLELANQTLADSEQRLRLAVATGCIGLWVWNSTDVTNAGDWSPRLKEIFGLPLDTEVTHEIFLQCVHPEDRERVNEGVMQALTGANGGDYACEYRTIPLNDGSQRWVTARGQAFFNSEGQPVRFIGTVMDITERKRGEEALAAQNAALEERVADRTASLARTNQALQTAVANMETSQTALERALEEMQDLERQFRLAVDTIPELVWTSLPDGYIDFLNQRWRDYTGLTLEEARGWGWQAAVHPEDLPGLVEYWGEVLSLGRPGETEGRLRRKDGEYRWFLFRAVPLYDEAGRLVKWYGSNTDIEDRRRAVEGLRLSEHLARGQLNALTRTLDSLSQEPDPDKLPKHVVKTILSQLDAHSVTVWERNEDSLDLVGLIEEGRFQTRSEAGYFDGSLPVVGDAPPLWIEALQTGAHTLIEDIDKEPCRIILSDGRSAVWHSSDLTAPFAKLKTHFAGQGIRGLLISPMMLAGRLAGIIGIRFTGTRVFEREEIELTKALAHQAMLAIQLTRLSAQSRESAVMAERNRMARDIHDTLAQGFTGVIVQLEAADDAKSRGLSSEMDEHLQRAGELARESLREARRSVRALRPQALEEMPLCGALDSLFKKMTAGTTLHSEFILQGAPRPLPPEWEENLLRVGQEALTNVLRHARASQIQARLAFTERELRFDLRDNGCGFDPAGRFDGFGRLGMKERVEGMGGQLTIQSEPGKGTVISIVLPLADHSLSTP